MITCEPAWRCYQTRGALFVASPRATLAVYQRVLRRTRA
jgi:hypothetical protein